MSSSGDETLSNANILERYLDADSPIYDHLVDVPNNPPIFLFNNGHVTHQLQPHLEELVTEFGARPYKIKALGANRFHTYVGIEPSELLRFVTERINPGELADILLNFLIGVTDLLPVPGVRKLLQEKAAGRVDTDTVEQIIFGLRQQLGQRNDPSQYVNIAEQAIEQQMYESAEKAFTALRKTFRSMTRQYQAGLVFFGGLQEFLSQKGNSERFAAHPQLLFELENTRIMLGQIEVLLVEETLYQARIEKMRRSFNDSHPDQE